MPTKALFNFEVLWKSDKYSRIFQRRFWLFYTVCYPETVMVYEEYLIYDTIGMIGSIGGTLGLFIGFSFTNAITFILNYLQNLRIVPRKQCNIQAGTQFLRKIKVNLADEQPKLDNQWKTEVNKLQKHIKHLEELQQLSKEERLAERIVEVERILLKL